jgi:hypothetical protein
MKLIRIKMLRDETEKYQKGTEHDVPEKFARNYISRGAAIEVLAKIEKPLKAKAKEFKKPEKELKAD